MEGIEVLPVGVASLSTWRCPSLGRAPIGANMKICQIPRRTAVLIVVGVFLVTSSAAHAAGPPHTVSVGGSAAPASHPFSAVSTGSLALNAKNNAGTVINFNCTSVSLSGTITSGQGVNPFASITTTWTGCTLPGGAMSIVQSGTWNLTSTSSNATAGSESVAGYIGNVSAHMFTTANPNIWNFYVNGHMSTSFNESTQQLTINESGNTGNLTLSNVRGCLGQLQNGNTMNLAATLNVTSPDGAINLS